MSIIDHIVRQMEFSARTFGPGSRKDGICDHIKKELVEIEESENDPGEWVDVWLLSMDGAWRCARENFSEITDREVAEIISELREAHQGVIVPLVTETSPFNVVSKIENFCYQLTTGTNDLRIWARMNVVATLGLIYSLSDESPERSLSNLTDLGFDMILQKQAKNERRDWPDWRTAEPGKAIEHVRGTED